MRPSLAIVPRFHHRRTVLVGEPDRWCAEGASRSLCADVVIDPSAVYCTVSRTGCVFYVKVSVDATHVRTGCVLSSCRRRGFVGGLKI